MKCPKCGKYLYEISGETCPYCDEELTDTYAYLNAKEKEKYLVQEQQAVETKRTKRFVEIILAVAAYLIVIISLASRDIPEFIRKIQGEDFIGMLFIQSVLLLVICAILFYISEIICAKISYHRSKNMFFSDNDLLLIQKSDRFEMTGYYILKGILHHILSVEKKNNNGSISYSIGINPDVPQMELTEYCDKNPSVKKIVNYLKSKGHSTDARNIVSNVSPTPTIQSKGGLQANSTQKMMSFFRNFFFWGCTATIMYFGITKLVMGINHDKPVSYLVMTLLLISFPLFYIYLGAQHLEKQLFIKHYQLPLFQYKATGLKQTDALLKALDGTKSYDTETITKMLRNYIVRYSDLSTRLVKSTNKQFLYDVYLAVHNEQIALAKAIAAAEAAKRASSSGSGCSGCSSCSGCSGCGGCGGCGD